MAVAPPLFPVLPFQPVAPAGVKIADTVWFPTLSEELSGVRAVDPPVSAAAPPADVPSTAN
jgi:hypothetical protein